MNKNNAKNNRSTNRNLNWNNGSSNNGKNDYTFMRVPLRDLAYQLTDHIKHINRWYNDIYGELWNERFQRLIAFRSINRLPTRNRRSYMRADIDRFTSDLVRYRARIVEEYAQMKEDRVAAQHEMDAFNAITPKEHETLTDLMEMLEGLEEDVHGMIAHLDHLFMKARGFHTELMKVNGVRKNA